MSDADRIHLQQAGVKLTLAGQFQDAVVCFQQALAGAEGIVRANILRDYADVVRHFRGRELEADSMLHESLSLLNQDQQPVEYASTLHFIARLDRQIGKWRWRNRRKALREMRSAVDILQKHKPTDREEIYATLDMAAIFAINFQPRRARKMAQRAETLLDRFEIKSRAHRARVKFLIWLPWWPIYNLPFVRRAFWGRMAK